MVVIVTSFDDGKLMDYHVEACPIRSLCNKVTCLNQPALRPPKCVIYIQSDLPNAATWIIRSENCGHR